MKREIPQVVLKLNPCLSLAKLLSLSRIKILPQLKKYPLNSKGMQLDLNPRALDSNSKCNFHSPPLPLTAR